MASKPTAREQGKAARAALDTNTRAGYNQRIVEACQQSLDWANYSRVMVFFPITRHNEINLWPLVKWLRKAYPKVEVYAPRVVGDELEAVKVAPQAAFQEGQWGVPEPAHGHVLDPSEKLDVVFIPLLGFDEAGNRVGYGRGFYDRFLAGCPSALKVGVAYEDLRMSDGIEANLHDIPLDAVVTEAGFQVLR